MGYRNEQFYKQDLGQAWDDTSGGNRSFRNYYYPDADNPRFVYPDRTVRTYEIEKVPLAGSNEAVTFYGDRIVSKRTLLQRGFIRSIARTSDEEVRKCQFQFNPQTIRQDVQMSESVLNFFQQDPGQFAQPMAGNTNMSFTIMFDRTMEINNPTSLSYSPTSGVVSGADNGGLGSGSVATRNPWARNSPSQVGVLRDIAALYGVIGQGVSEADAASRIQEISNTIKAEAIGNVVDAEEESPDIDGSIANIQEVLAANLGNYSLLVPKPVRLVYSSLYMVEGYVTSTSVTFTKFNTAFVPIQAVVNITMKAVHIGSLQDDTFLTYSLEQAEVFQQQLEAEETANQQAIIREVAADLESWSIRIDDDNSLGTYPSLSDFDVASKLSGYDGDRFRIELECNGDFSVLEQLFDAGSTRALLSANIKVYTDLDPGNLIDGTELIPPRIIASYVWDISRKPLVGDRTKASGDDFGKDNTFYSPWQSIPFFDPINVYGETWKYVWSVSLSITHEGQTVSEKGAGSATYTGPGPWNGNTALQETVRLNFNPGETESETEVGTGVSSNAPGPGEPSEVD